VNQTLEKVSEKEKLDRLFALLVNRFSQAHDMNQVPLLAINFVKRKARCDEVSIFLVEQGFKATTLH